MCDDVITHGNESLYKQLMSYYCKCLKLHEEFYMIFLFTININNGSFVLEAYLCAEYKGIYL